MNNNDLISRNTLFEQLRLAINRSYLGETAASTEISIGELASIINDVPIAYDPEQVISEIKEKSRVMSTKDPSHKYYKAIGTKVCEEIIRKGGV